jgi:hypothetical protein
MDKNEKARLQEMVSRVRGNMKITKVVATRAVKTKRGDFFAGMSAAWNSVQDDVSGMGADSELMMKDGDIASSGMSVEDARVAHILLGMEASIAAWRAALTDGAISHNEFDNRVATIKHNTAEHLQAFMEKPEAKAKAKAS